MPRPPRIYLESALYYVTSRGDFQQNIFNDESDYKMFLDLLKKYKEQYKFKLFAYCLLPNHFHLLLELPTQQKEQNYKAGLLSNIMHDLNSSYTKYFNGKYGRKGHLFRERYKVALIEKDTYLLSISAYIHLNPQRLNLVSSAQQYPFSSYLYYLNRSLPLESLMEEEGGEILRLLNGQDYVGFIEKIAKESDFSRLHNYLEKGVLGTKDFEEQVRRASSAYTYRKERAGDTLSFAQKLGIVSLIVVLAGVGITFILKLTLLEDRSRKMPAPLDLTYKLSTQVKKLIRDIENAQWSVRIVSLTGGKVENDIVRFEEGKFISRNYSLKSYSPSDYFLIIADNDKITWETTQVGPNGAVSWRGEIKNGEMEGGLRLRYSDGKTQDFSFVSVGSRER